MNKKVYLKPATRTVEMRHRMQMLQFSEGVEAGRKSYGEANDDKNIPTTAITNGRWVWQ